MLYNKQDNNFSTGPTSKQGGISKKYFRRKSEDDGGLDFFLAQKDLNLDFLEWDDIKNTRVGRKISM